MRKLLILLTFLVPSAAAFAQESMEKTMETRAREMHRVIGLNDPAVWKKFIKENYTQALIDKPMRAKVQTSEEGNTSTKTEDVKAADNLEAKAGMFQRLHDDFGDSKIVSLKPNGEKLAMVVKNSEGMTGTFQLKFDKNKPYLIDGLGIEVNADMH